jgi:hypothetical protein
MASGCLMSQHTFKWTTERFCQLGPYNTERLNFVIFIWGSIISARFQMFLIDGFDRKGREMHQSPLLQDGRKM